MDIGSEKEDGQQHARLHRPQDSDRNKLSASNKINNRLFGYCQIFDFNYLTIILEL